MVGNPRLLAARWAAIFERLEPQFGECWWTGLVSCHKSISSPVVCPLAYVGARLRSRKLCRPRKKLRGQDRGGKRASLRRRQTAKGCGLRRGAIRTDQLA